MNNTTSNSGFSFLQIDTKNNQQPSSKTMFTPSTSIAHTIRFQTSELLLLNETTQRVVNTVWSLGMDVLKTLFTLMIVLSTVLATQEVYAFKPALGTDKKLTRGEDWCGSPRFLVSRGDSNSFSLRSTEVNATLLGVIADVHIRQVYVNSGRTPAEATYIFPLSTRAAVYGMKMTVGDRIITAKVQTKQQARTTYTNAINEGRSATLLEQIKSNIVQMSVGNIMPKDSIVVDVTYTEAINLSEGVYEFVYPAVVGPRYVSNVNPNEYDDILSSRDIPQEVPGKFTIKTRISAGLAAKAVESPSHEILTKITQLSKESNTLSSVKQSNRNTQTEITLAKPNDPMNRDFVVRYRLSGQDIESGLLLTRTEKENYFMLMVQPPREVEIPSIVPREFIFIVDVSGSMYGFPLNTAKYLMDKLFTTLRPTDKFNIMLFSGGQKVLSPKSLPATQENITSATTFMNSGYGGGGTELLPALQQAFSMEIEKGYARNFVVVTDGYVTIEKQAFDLVRKNLNTANIYAFGIGSNVNRLLIEGLARAGKAEPMIVNNQNTANEMADKFREYIEAPVLTDMRVDYGDLDVYDVDPPAIPSATAKRPVVIFGKWKGNPTGKVTLRGRSAEGEYSFSVNVAGEPIRPEHSALKYLWARNRITYIEDGFISPYGSGISIAEEEKKIADIGLEYNLLTKYTSFVAVDSVISVKKSMSDNKKEVPNLNGDSIYSRGVNLGGQTVVAETVPVSTTYAGISGGNADRNKMAKKGKSPMLGLSIVEDVNGNSSTPSNQITATTQTVPAGTKNLGNSRGTKSNVRDSRSTRSSQTGSAKGVGIEKGNLSNEVAIVADRKKMVDSKVVGVTKTISGNEITAIPESPVPIATTQAGVQHSAGELVIRGSRSTDTQIRVDRQDISDPISNGLGAAPRVGETLPNAPTASQYATQETQVMTGNFSAGYGNTVGGVVSQTISTGEDDVNPLTECKKKPNYYFGFIAGYSSAISGVADMTVNGVTGSIAPRGGGFHSGFTLEYLLGDPKSARSAISFDLMYEGTSGSSSFIAQGVTAFRAQDGLATTTNADYLNELNIRRLLLRPMFRQSLGYTPFGVLVGTTVGINLGSKLISTATLPTEMLWQSNGSRVQTTEQTFSTVSAALSLGLQYELILRRVNIIPHVIFDIPLTGLSNSLPLKQGMLRAGISVRFSL
jgi:Ca-activated chloride channel homolog